VTLAQVAELAGVSVMTASYAYNRPDRVSEDARARVLDAAARLGYAGPDPSARSLRSGSTGTIGVVLGEHLSYAFEDPQAASFLAGVADVCADHGRGMTILPATGGADDAARIRATAVDGFVIWTTSDDDPILPAVRAMRRPTAVHGGPEIPGWALVGIDDRAAAEAVGAVAFADAVRPAVVSFPLSRDRFGAVTRGVDPAGVRYPVTRRRLEGYRQAAGEAGIGWDDVPVAVCARNDAGEAERITTELLATPEPPDAVAAMSDELASGVIRAVRASGRRVPGDVAVTGWDDGPPASRLGLTTIAQSLREQGAACAHAALGQAARSPAAAWSLVRRGSTRR
jgi:DNA-binding LacI/PurR family transcriptional regulator